MSLTGGVVLESSDHTELPFEQSISFDLLRNREEEGESAYESTIPVKHAPNSNVTESYSASLLFVDQLSDYAEQ